MSNRGIFIVIEGLDGSGKTTQASLLANELAKKYSTILTTEPSKGKIGSFIREYYLYEEQRLPTDAEALLFAADRLEHVKKELVPALDEGKIVICDRYLHSSLAYQGSSGLSIEWIRGINSKALHPDIGIFIDVTPEIVLNRLHRKRSVMETLETQQKVREIYLKFVENGELVRIDGDKPKEDIAAELYLKVTEMIESFRDTIK